MGEKLLKRKNDGGRYEATLSCLWGIFLFCLLIFIDQITKVVADVYFNADGAPDYIAVIPKGVIGLCISYNDGIAWGGFGDASPLVKIGIIVGTGVMMIALAVVWCKADYRRRFLRVALVFVIAGGVGNLIDRLYYRIWDPASTLGVRDMVQLDFGAILRGFFNINVSEQFLNFGVCNFADFFIVGGAIALMLALLFFDKDAIFPMGKKYKALAQEAEKEAEEKKVAKAKKRAKHG